VNERQTTIHTSRRKIVLHLWWNTNDRRILEGMSLVFGEGGELRRKEKDSNKKKRMA